MKHSLIQKLTGASLIAMVLVTAGTASVQAQSSESSAAAAAEVRFQQLEKEVRRLTGQVEEQNYKIQQLQEELAKQAGDLSVRMSDIENNNGGGGANPSAPAEPNNTSSGSATNNYYMQQQDQAQSQSSDEPVEQPQELNEPIDAPSANNTGNGNSFYTPPQGKKADGQLGTLNQSTSTGQVSGGSAEAAEYEQAYAYIKSRDFEAAESAFESFIAKYPNSSYMTNAKYWYGETFFVRGNYEKAARIFAESYQANPKGNKAAGNLLKLGMSLAGLGKKDDACVAFKQLQKDYASSAVPILKRADTEMRRIGCR